MEATKIIAVSTDEFCSFYQKYGMFNLYTDLALNKNKNWFACVFSMFCMNAR